MARRQADAASTASFYEDFQPKSELKEEQGAYIQVVHLPDFSKDQVRIIYIDSTRTVRVQGERPLENNRRKRFNRTFPVPQNCIVDKIHGKFQEGTLTITMPKQTPSPPQPASTPPTKITEPSPVPAPPPKQPSPVTAPSVAAPPPKLAVPAQLQQEDATGKDQKRPPASQTPQKPITETTAQKGQEQVDTTAKATPKQRTESDDSQTKDKEKKVDAPKAQYESKSQTQDETPPLFGTEKKTEKQGTVESKAESIKKSDETAAPKCSEKKGDVVGEKGKVEEETSFMEKARQMKNVAVATMKTAMEKKEDRQLILNMGVAVLVIVAVGAYVTYKIRSSAKAKE